MLPARFDWRSFNLRVMVDLHVPFDYLIVLRKSITVLFNQTKLLTSLFKKSIASKSAFVGQNNTTSKFLRLSKVWSILQHGSVDRVQNKEYSILYAFFYFFKFFDVFHYKICVFIISTSFFDRISNFRNRILTNQKQVLLVRNCQWNCTVKTVTSLSKI